MAGNDTTRTAISHGMHLLPQNPEQRADLAGRPRRRHAAPRSRRSCGSRRRSRSCAAPSPTTSTLSGQDFDEGDKLVLFYGAANRDPRVFDDPERFDVRRDPNPHVGFGGPGPHFCLGAHLARREVAVVFRQLLTRLPDIEVVGDPVPLEAMGIPLVGGIKRLPVRFTPTARRVPEAAVTGAGRRSSPYLGPRPRRCTMTRSRRTPPKVSSRRSTASATRSVCDACSASRTRWTGARSSPWPRSWVVPGAVEARATSRAKSGTGFGTGFGLQARPVGVYQVRDGEVVWKPAIDVTRLAKGGQALAALFAICVTLIAIAQRPR